MAFLTLNDLTIPIARGGSANVVNHGNNLFAFDGRQFRENRSRYRKWQFETSIIAPDVGEELIGLLNGKGDRLQFEHTTPFVDSDTYSDKGLEANTSGTEKFALKPNLAADGKSIVDSNDIAEAKYSGNSSLVIEQLNDNIASDDSSDCENGTNGWNAGGTMVLAQDATNYAQGTYGIKCTTGGVGDSAYCDAISCSTGTTYTFVIYIYASASQTVRLGFEENAGGWSTLSTKDVTVDNSGWKRVFITDTTGGAATQIRLDCEDRSGAGYFVIDAFNCVEADLPTQWVLGQTARTQGNLTYPVYFPNDECTVMLWCKNEVVTYGTLRNLVSLASSTDSGGFGIYNTASQNYLGFESAGTDGSTTTGNVTSADISDEDWHHVAFVLKADHTSGAKYREIYFDGSLEDSGATANYPQITTLDLIKPGAAIDGSGLNWDAGAIDELMVLPFAATADYVSAIYNSTNAPVDLPYLRAHGDALTDDARYGVEVFGSVEAVEYVPIWISGSHTANAMRIRFSLETREEY